MFIVTKDGKRVFQGTIEECAEYAEKNGGKVEKV